MKKFTIWLLVIIAIILIAWFSFYHKKADEQAVLPPAPESITGCYVAHLAQDVYTLHVNSQDLDMFSGTLAYDNFEKDSSHGTFSGTYRDGILLGNYSFSSEGMDSVRQVIFKKSGNDFIEGFGAYDAQGENFVDPSNVTYDASTTFVNTPNCAS